LKSKNDLLENNYKKLIKLNSEWDPEVVVEGTKIKGNIEDMRDIFMSICSAMKETKDYCRINVNSKIWR